MMSNVYIYARDAEDLECTGLVGALIPLKCEHEEIAGGMSAITLVHPFDAEGRWRAIERGCILKCDTRVRTTPEIEHGQVVTAIEVWSVRATASKAQRYVYSKPVKGKKKKLLAPNTEVAVVKKGESRYKIRTGRTSGWIAHEALEFVLAETLAGTTDAIEAIAPPWIVRPQLFRVMDVDVNTKNGTVTAYAPHISYDLAFNNTRFKHDEPLGADDALAGILDGCGFETEFEFYTDLADERTSCDWTNISPMRALLDPETGFLARWGAQLVRDDYELYFLLRAGRNRGVRIEYAKNLLGVDMKSSDDKVITAILPTGERKDGSTLYLTDDADSPGNYVYSDYADLYPVRHVHVLACQDCKVSKGISIDLARARMREQARRMFTEDRCDQPDISLTVDYVQLGDTEEYKQYAQLESVYLYDEVPVADRSHGIEAQTTVQRLVYDCLLERVIEIELGNVRLGADSVYSWQIPSLPGSKLDPGSVPGSALEDGAVSEEKLDADLQEALNKAWADIEHAQGMLDAANAWLDTLEAQLETVTFAVGDNAGAIAALQLASDTIRAAVRDAEANIAALEITAHEIATALADAEGNISSLRQTSNSMSSTISSLSGSISSIRQTVDSLTSTIYGAGGLTSQIQQLASGVAVKLRDPSVDANFELSMRSNPAYSYWANPTKTCYGIDMRYNGTYYGGLFMDGADPSMTNWNQLLISPGHQRLLSTGGLDIMSIDPARGSTMYIFFDPDYASGKRLRISESWTVDSDKRLKKDIAPINQGEAMFDALRPCQYRMRADDTCLHFGFITQDVKDVHERLGIPETVMLADAEKESGYMGLNYQEFISLTVHKVQRMQARMDELERRLSQLEGTAC